MEARKLCLKLAGADTEEEIISILKELSYWDNTECWKIFNNESNNFDRIGNQQSSPDAALVEKLINSIDSMLIKECLARGINPEDSEKAPETIQEAAETFFDVKRGQLFNVTASDRTKLSSNICLVATGQKKNPSYCIIDQGEGQRPNKVESTFLSLSKQNKLKIPFVQGKFNMGGTGVLRFCGRGSGANNIQLIITKRHPKVADKENDDDTKNNWSFTIVRREDPVKGGKSSVYTYLAPDSKILNFNSEDLPLLPGEYPKVLQEPLKWGTFIKLYEYQMSGLKTNVILDLYFRLSLLMPNLALPIRMLERRKGYKAHSYETTLSGLSVRLEEDKRDNLEEGFPSSSTFSVFGQKMNCSIYAFKKGQAEKYRKGEGILFTINGQTHGDISKSFFERSSVKMGYLKNSLLILIDCSKFNNRTREDLFMNSRDRLQEGDLKKEIENKLAELVRQHPGLRELRERRRRQEIEDKLEDSRPLSEVVADILKKAPTLSHLFIKGLTIKNPFNLKNVGQSDKPYKGELWPTYFKLVSPKEGQTKTCHIKSKFRAIFETDAQNDFFNRDEFPGEFRFYINDNEAKDSSMSLWNGKATLSANLPSEAKIGDKFVCLCKISDESARGDIDNKFEIVIDKELKSNGGGKSTESKPPSGEGKDRKEEERLSLPNINEVREDKWHDHEFNKYSALEVVDSDEEGYDFHVNMDNIYLLNEIKTQTKAEPKLLEARYKYALVLIGLSILKDHKENNEEKEEANVFKKIVEFTKAVSPVLLPMITTLGDLNIDEE